MKWIYFKFQYQNEFLATLLYGLMQILFKIQKDLLKLHRNIR
jgi:hypothetical protein